MVYSEIAKSNAKKADLFVNRYGKIMGVTENLSVLAKQVEDTSRGAFFLTQSERRSGTPAAALNLLKERS